MEHRPPVPEQVPGYLITDPEQLDLLRQHLTELCGLPNINFWVCEKSDGVRVIVLIVVAADGQQVYLVDRKYDFYQVVGLRFPHQEGLEYDHSNTVLDGELVIDVEPERGNVLRLLLFDILVVDSENLMQKSLMGRYGRLKEYIMKPHEKLLAAQPELREHLPFEVRLKTQELSYGIEAVFRDHVPKLLHGNDGLIFTSAEAVYTPGTDQKILKWKPPSENSIDFKLQLKFPARDDSPHEPDFYAKPVFMLMMNHGREGHHYFDTMVVDDETWETWKASGEQYDDRVIEVVWDFQRSSWKMLRFRDDKFDGNYKTVVQSIIKSIMHGVEEEQLVQHAPKIKAAWKARAEAKKVQDEKRKREEEDRRRQQFEAKRSTMQPPPPQIQGGVSNGGGGGGNVAPRGPIVGGLKR